MVRRTLLFALCALGAACQPGGPRKTGPAVAKGSGLTITADEFKARLDEQSPFIRGRYTTLERKKEFLDNMIRFEVLANEAEKQGLRNDPDVQLTIRRIMVQKLVQKSFQPDAPGAEIPEPELQKYYDDHRDDYNRPRKVRVAAVVFNAPESSPDRAKKVALARKALQKLKAEEKKNTLAFAQIVSEFSEDAATKATAGDLQFRSKDELEKTYSKNLADAAFALKPGETSGVVEGPLGVYIVKYTGEQPELSRTFDQMKAQIAARLQRERKTKEFDEWLKRLRDQARVTIDEKALDGVKVAATPMPASMGGMPPGMPPGHPQAPGQPLAASSGPVPAPRPPAVNLGPRPAPTAPPAPRAIAPAPQPAPAPAPAPAPPAR